VEIHGELGRKTARAATQKTRCSTYKTVLASATEGVCRSREKERVSPMRRGTGARVSKRRREQGGGTYRIKISTSSGAIGLGSRLRPESRCYSLGGKRNTGSKRSTSHDRSSHIKKKKKKKRVGQWAEPPLAPMITTILFAKNLRRSEKEGKRANSGRAG